MNLHSSIVAILVALTSPFALAVQTSHWTHANETEFKKGSLHHVVVTNLGDVKLSRAVETILEQDSKVSAIYAIVQTPDGAIYAGTGPNGLLLRVKDGKATTVADFGENNSIFALTVDNKGNLLIGVSGETGKLYRLEKPADANSKPVEIFTDEQVQYIWGIQQTPDEKIYVATGPNGKLFEIEAEKKPVAVLATDETNLLALISDGKDLLYIGTDPNGLIYRFNRKTKESFVMFDAPESEISTLVLDGKGNLYVGTAEAVEQGAKPGVDEKAGRPEPAGGTPVPATPREEPKPPVKPEPNPQEPPAIPKADAEATRRVGVLTHRVFLSTSETVGEYTHRTVNNQIYFLVDNPAAGDKKKPAPGPTSKPSAPTAPITTLTPEVEVPPQPKPQGSAIYKIDPEGFVTEIFRQPVLVLSMLEQNGNLLVGTGSDGLVYQVNPITEETVVLAKLESKQVLSMSKLADGTTLIGSANVGRISKLSDGFATEGTFTSPVLDAAQISRFGKIHLHGTLPENTSLTISARSSNLQDAAKAGWSPWSDEVAAKDYMQLSAPSARFFQYRLTLKSTDPKATPSIDEIDMAYQMPNIAPNVKSIKIGSAASAIAGAIASGSSPGTGGSSAATGASTNVPAIPSADISRYQTINWEADDANGDALIYSVYFRSSTKSPWILLKDKLAENHLDWDTKLVSDGRYEVKVVASDANSNPPGTGKTGSRTFSNLVIDNTPPVIGDVSAAVKAGVATIKAKAVDRVSIVAAMEYTIDSSTDWQLVLPSNKIFDSPEASVELVLAKLSAGAHQITLRATDAKGNQAFETVLVQIDQPAAGRKE